MAMVVQRPEAADAFAWMTKHINAGGCMSMAEYESIFGEVTRAAPYGARFWEGYRYFMINMYRPRMKKLRSLSGVAPTEAWFEIPAVFSKAAAQQPKPNGDYNDPGAGPLRKFYPCWVWHAGGELWYMICLHLALWYAGAWCVHSSWVTIIGCVPLQPTVFTTSTVTVEEVPTDSDDESDDNEYVHC